ncbi:MAG: energy transducer TonB [Steroidobacteraceae bacterium]|nr:energy transducer TonB [Steroidobacteraceae bacterium]
MLARFRDQLFRLLCVLALVVVATPAQADFATALADFKAGRHEAAAREFERLAWLGLAPAQSGIAVALANGQGVPRNPGKAAAWAGIAAQGGEPSAHELYQTILPMLNSSDMDEMMALERAYQAVALEDRLRVRQRPPVDTGPRSPAYTVPQRIGELGDIYPRAAINQGWEGYVYLVIDVDSQGVSHDPRVLIADPPGKFEADVTEAMLATRWKPATRDGEPVAANLCMLLMFQFSSMGDNHGMRGKVRELRAEAEGGNVGSQFATAVLWAAYPDVTRLIPQDEAQRWMVAALEARFPPALMMSAMCSVDEKFGPRALELSRAHGGKDLLEAARRGSPPAQLQVARVLLDDEKLNLAARTRRAIGWLELAESGPDPVAARIRLAHVLATTPVAEIRDPDRARSLIEPLRRQWAFDPRVKETLAALEQSPQP